ncbi:Sensor protein ZraS [Paenibacillus konkukensis]|uniref:histidine kinase n=2 Tax=Paenibacillus konkukensis TaxID=2020716 RepID=A0ABY4RTB0_9BACL|nr:Sensor protein ZraS [Paenibacillus konkukensis]
MLFYLTFLFMFVSLTTLGIYLSIKHRRNRLIFWTTAIIFCTGLVGPQIILEKRIVPSLTHHGSAFMIDSMNLLTGTLNFFISTFPYYAILVFYLIYNNYMRKDKWMLGALSVPLWMTLLIQTDLSVNKLNTAFISAWGLVYVLAVWWLAIRPVVMEKDLRKRAHHIAIALMFLVPVTILNVYHFSSSVMGDRILIFIPYLCVGSILLLLILYLRGAFLGLQRKSIRTVHVGTAIIHHSLKNSIGKIKLNALNIRKSLTMKRYEEIEPMVDNLLTTHEAMMKTMATISRAVSDKTELHKERHDLAIILDEIVDICKAFSNIRVDKCYRTLMLPVDRQLLSECILNICNNAIEAMEGEGTLRIKTESRRRKVLLSIGDNGPGMNSVQLHNVFEPFFSTKHRTREHFGLGMYHVKRVMEAHGGKVEIRSAPGQGTTVILTLRQTV